MHVTILSTEFALDSPQGVSVSHRKSVRFTLFFVRNICGAETIQRSPFLPNIRPCAVVFEERMTPYYSTINSPITTFLLSTNKYTLCRIPP